MLSIIVAIANKNVIGKDNSLIWHLPGDLKRFKDITSGKTIIMGRKTFESLPFVLPYRHHLVLTRDNNYTYKDEKVTVIHSLEELLPYINDNSEHFIIGGGEIYTLLLPYVQKLYITKIDADFEGDTYFPYFDANQWILTEEIIGIDNTFPNKYLTYIRKQPYKDKL